jgi:hypothetical protein
MPFHRAARVRVLASPDMRLSAPNVARLERLQCGAEQTVGWDCSRAGLGQEPTVTDVRLGVAC